MSGLNVAQIVDTAKGQGVSLSNDQANTILGQAWDQSQYGADAGKVNGLIAGYKAPAQPSNPSPSGGGSSAPANLTGLFGTPSNSINLPQLYDQLTSKAGISDKEAQLSKDTQGFNTEMSTINDNPFLSEGNRTGRGAKLQTDYNNDTAGVRSDIATAKADVATKIGLATQQFNINSQEAQQAMTQFNSLLSSGALDNADGNTIAQITTATGLPSNVIQSAIDASKAKANLAKTNVQYVTNNQTGEVTAVVLNSQTGDVISKQSLGNIGGVASKVIPGASGGGKTDQNNLTKTDYTNYLIGDIKNKVTLKSLVNHYSPYLSVDDIYNYYRAMSPWGAPKETLAQVKKGQYAD